MLTAILDALTRTPRRALATAAVATVVAALPATAHAHERFHVNVAVPVASCPPQAVWVEPVYRTVCERQWVPATVQTVNARVWVEPVTTAAPRRVFVPDQYGWRTVLAYDGWGRPCRGRQWVVVVPAHYEDRCDAAVVTPGHYEPVPQQQVVCEGHWTTADRQELVTPGHWETPAVAVPAYAPPVALGVRLRF